MSAIGVSYSIRAAMIIPCDTTFKKTVRCCIVMMLFCTTNWVCIFCLAHSLAPTIMILLSITHQHKYVVWYHDIQVTFKTSDNKRRKFWMDLLLGCREPLFVSFFFINSFHHSFDQTEETLKEEENWKLKTKSIESNKFRIESFVIYLPSLLLFFLPVRKDGKYE